MLLQNRSNQKSPNKELPPIARTCNTTIFSLCIYGAIKSDKIKQHLECNNITTVTSANFQVDIRLYPAVAFITRFSSPFLVTGKIERR